MLINKFWPLHFCSCILFTLKFKKGRENQPWGRSCYQCYTVSTSNSWTLLPSASDAPNIVYFVRGGEDIMAARTSRRVLTREKWDNTVFKCVRIKHKSNKGLKGYIHECIKAKKLVSIPLCAILLYTRSLLCIPLHPHNTPPPVHDIITSKLRDSGKSLSKLSFSFSTSNPPQSPNVSME